MRVPPHTRFRCVCFWLDRSINSARGLLSYLSFICGVRFCLSMKWSYQKRQKHRQIFQRYNYGYCTHHAFTDTAWCSVCGRTWLFRGRLCFSFFLLLCSVLHHVQSDEQENKAAKDFRSKAHQTQTCADCQGVPEYVVNRTIMEIAQKISPHQKILVFSPSNMAFHHYHY